MQITLNSVGQETVGQVVGNYALIDVPVALYDGYMGTFPTTEMVTEIFQGMNDSDEAGYVIGRTRRQIAVYLSDAMVARIEQAGEVYLQTESGAHLGLYDPTKEAWKLEPIVNLEPWFETLQAWGYLERDQ